MFEGISTTSGKELIERIDEFIYYMEYAAASLPSHDEGWWSLKGAQHAAERVRSIVSKSIPKIEGDAIRQAEAIRDEVKASMPTRPA